MLDSIGRSLRLAREARGVSQEELARRIGVSRLTIYRWEMGQMKPTQYRRRQIERFIRSAGTKKGG